MTDIDIKAIREVAKAATPGYWWVAKAGHIVSAEGGGIALPPNFMQRWNWDANAKHIVTARPETVIALCDEIERLQKEVHNLNWALGTEGYTEMATPEEQAEHEAGMADVQAILDRMQAAKDAQEAIEKDAARYRWLRSHPLSFGHGSLQVFMDDRCGSGNDHKIVWDKELDAAIDKQLERKT